MGWDMIDRAAKGAGKMGRAGEGSALCQIKSLLQWRLSSGDTIPNSEKLSMVYPELLTPISRLVVSACRDGL